MKIAALAHFSLPWRNCGSEVVIHELLKAAAAAGHDVTMWCTHETPDRVWRGTKPSIVLDGVTVHRMGNPIMAAKAMARSRPDVVVTHHQHATQAIRTAQAYRARSVFLTHNQMDINKRPLSMRPDLVIHNSEWVRESLQRFGEQREELVMHPPLTPDRHVVDSTGGALTLINLNRDKGAELFYKLAETMPDREFLGVVGGHGQQVIRRSLPNVTILEHGPDMRRVWSGTRVLLMPSIYESYGLTAVEAGINGIPTIANPTPGLLENLGSGGSFADRDDPDAWVRQIEMLDDPAYYIASANYAGALAHEAMHATRQSLTQWTDWLSGV